MPDDCGHDLAAFERQAQRIAELEQRVQQLSSRAIRSEGFVGVPLEQWQQVRAVVDAAKAWRQVDCQLPELGARECAAMAVLAAAVDALDEDDPREEVSNVDWR